MLVRVREVGERVGVGEGLLGDGAGADVVEVTVVGPADDELVALVEPVVLDALLAAADDPADPAESAPPEQAASSTTTGSATGARRRTCLTAASPRAPPAHHPPG